MTVRTYGDPILREVARIVTAFDADLAALSEGMLRTIEALGANGIAGNQVGVLQRLFVWREGADAKGACVNPRLLTSSIETESGEEGCVSFPRSFRLMIERSARVDVSFQDILGVEHQRTVEGRLARTFLHEMDHLNGILFIDHLAMHEKARVDQFIAGGGLDNIPQPIDGLRAQRTI